MSHELPSPLPIFDRMLLRSVEKVVPSSEREEWLQTWEAELWHVCHRSRNRGSRSFGIIADLSVGLTCDAVWLRTESWRRAFSGTAVLCLASLLGLCVVSALFGLVLSGGWHSFSLNLGGQFKRFLIETPLVVFVTFATSSRRHLEQHTSGKRIYWIRRQLFFAAKSALVLLSAFLLSVDVCTPIHTPLPYTSEILQIWFSVLFSLIGLRWSFHDKEQRCKQCLRALATPARVGRPSHNLLEWNGSELICKQGHGLLSVPEIETSWCQSSQWVDQKSDWGQAASA
jgi:hypothetical protein